MGKAKRGATDLFGILAIDKPAGITSHDVVSRMRRLTGEGRIGHAGTLDPAATGLLIVCLGPATRLADLIMAKTKSYEARIVFGAQTDTDDAEGQVVKQAAIPANLTDTDFAQRILSEFLGEQLQMPPQFSAIKKGGVKAYQVARKGGTFELEPRRINISKIELLQVGQNFWDVFAEVSKGTYIRSLARDIGERAGSLAHLGSLRRTSCGSLDVSAAHKLEDLEMKSINEIKELFIDVINDLGVDESKIPKALIERIVRPD